MAAPGFAPLMPPLWYTQASTRTLMSPLADSVTGVAHVYDIAQRRPRHQT